MQGKFFCFLVAAVLTPALVFGADSAFVSRSGSRLIFKGKPVYLLGANAYYLMEQAASGDTTGVRRVLSDASHLGLTIVRTWAFADSPDSTNPGTVQYRPGAFNESALRALDFVVREAKTRGLHLVLPLVNSWDQYGGMNQYVRWRTSNGPASARSNGQEGAMAVTGSHGRSYQIYVQGGMTHDDFYTESIIQQWFRNYISMMLQRVNVFTGIANKDEPCIMAWELANEPRSSDRSGGIVRAWLRGMSAYAKLIDPHHLIGSGEEGFDVSAEGYDAQMYDGQSWLFDGTEGISFTDDLSVSDIDFGSIHLYPDSWGILRSSGASWIEDHLRIAGGLQKPLVIGEFGVNQDQATTYESWLTSGLLDGIAGAAVWQLLDSAQVDPEGFGIYCPSPDQVCTVIQSMAEEFLRKTEQGALPLPATVTLMQNYPNPFNRETVISYTLPFDANVDLSLYNLLGEHVRTLASGFQHAGLRKELFDGWSVASGAYFYTLRMSGVGSESPSTSPVTRKLLLIR